MEESVRWCRFISVKRQLICFSFEKKPVMVPITAHGELVGQLLTMETEKILRLPACPSGHISTT
ncbi:hypothetical protein J3L18_11590 [Mucilaginibacter gossypii]|uniref:hypothetical protein n=1 Tax=Mucilaginibacter gossypii TaxID=551996 RepID=UPI00101A6E41|nr:MULTISPECIES: hypothetical protein [Mucilaginibacter]QTE39662.1 hypothetical protein J3L18_11590 [Mucilaginibacter gossypii]